MSLQPVGTWAQGSLPPAFSANNLLDVVPRIREPLFILRDPASGVVGAATGGQLIGGAPDGRSSFPVLAVLPALYPEWLGDRSFGEVHGTRFPYVAGAMANGITTTRIVIAMAKAGMMGFFGAAGLPPQRVDAALEELQRELGDRLPWGSNLIHSPNEPELEERIADLYIRRGVRRVSASAYMALTPAIVRYSATGLALGADGKVHRKHFVFAKISRPEVAGRFMAPAPAEMLAALVRDGKLTAQEAELARRVPVAEDYTVEADSGGHTDNQTLTALFPIILRLSDDSVAKYGYDRPIRLGAAGGLGSPSAIAAAFQLGASYVLTGSVNQAAIESGLHESGRKLLAQAGLGDVAMAPAADMFELGAKVQVLKRGTMFGVRAQRLHELYRTYDGYEFMPADVKQRLEREILGQTCEEVWASCESFFAERDPQELARAQADTKHKMALVFRWYLGLSSKWAIAGLADRRMDHQIWTGPAIGAFNDWVRGSFLEPTEARTVVQIAYNLLEGAAVITRAHQLRTYGVPVPAAAFTFSPRPLA